MPVLIRTFAVASFVFRLVHQVSEMPNVAVAMPAPHHLQLQYPA